MSSSYPPCSSVNIDGKGEAEKTNREAYMKEL